MRTPNTSCVICDRPLYRRPSDMARARYAACMEHRALAQKVIGITAAQKAALELGREKGTNHLEGIPKDELSKRKRSVAMLHWCRQHPEAVAARARKTRGANHYRWNGGSSKLNVSIRQMTEYRKWMDAVKARDGCCVQCGETAELESHHVIPLAELLTSFDITSRQNARKHSDALWDLNNGVALCRRCHYAEHGRAYAD